MNGKKTANLHRVGKHEEMPITDSGSRVVHAKFSESNNSPAAPSCSSSLIGNDYIRGFLQGALIHGYDPLLLLEKAGIRAEVYEDKNATIDGLQFQRLIGVLHQELNDVFLGFLAQPAKLAMEREQSRVRFQGQSLGEAIRFSTQFREAVRNDVTYSYHFDDEHHTFTLGIHYDLVEGLNEEVFYWHRLMQIYKFYCWLIGKRIKLNSISLTFEPAMAARDDSYFSIFNCELKVNQPQNSLTFDPKYLQQTIVRSAAEQGDLYEHYPDWFTVPGVDVSYARQTERVIASLYEAGNWFPKIDTVAKALAITSRSLRRKLARESETFQAIRARQRRDKAISLLLASNLPITRVAEDIGFAEPGDFTRAFIRWTGLTPSEYRSKFSEDKSQYLS